MQGFLWYSSRWYFSLAGLMIGDCISPLAVLYPIYRQIIERMINQWPDSLLSGGTNSLWRFLIYHRLHLQAHRKLVVEPHLLDFAGDFDPSTQECWLLPFLPHQFPMMLVFQSLCENSTALASLKCISLGTVKTFTVFRFSRRYAPLEFGALFMRKRVLVGPCQSHVDRHL